MRSVISANGLFLFLLLAGGCQTTGPVLPDAEVSGGKLTLARDGGSGELKLACAGKGTVLDQGTLAMPPAGAPMHVVGDAASGTMTFAYSGGRTAAIRLVENRLTVSASDRVELAFHGAVHQESTPAFLKDQKDEDCGVLVTALGPATVPGADSLYDPHEDLALTVEASNDEKWRFDEGWRLIAEGGAGIDTVAVTVIENYYRDELGIEFFKPFMKRSFWETAPIVAMTWYGICGLKQPQSLAVLAPEIDWVAEHLLPYAGKIVFQLDDNYDFEGDAAMRALSDYIRSKGLIPGIWFTPFGVAPESEYEKHPEWFLHDGDGQRLRSFAGLNWKWTGGGQAAGVIDVESPGAVENWYSKFWKKASETWNFDFFKIDGQPTAVNAYRRAAGDEGVQSYRKGLELGRMIVGPDKFINGCWGMPIEGAGIMDGSRTGGDTGYHGHAVNVVIAKNYLNHMLWWCDPDAAAMLHDAPVEKVRLNAQARALTGQQFLTDDMWTLVREENLRVWQRSFPMLPVRPANLYPLDQGWAAYDLFDLKIRKPWGTYDVVGFHNYRDRRCMKRLDLGRLPLEAGEVHLFEYWSSRYLGRFAADGVLDLVFEPHEGKLFSIVPVADDRPVLLSTSRHASQGGLDLEALEWERHGKGWKAAGKSSHLVGGDTYELVFASGRYRVSQAITSGGELRAENEPGLARVRIVPEESGAADWEVVFEVIRDPSISALKTSCDLAPGETMQIKLQSQGNAGFEWNAVASDPRIEIEVAEGDLGAWPAQETLSITADGSGLPPGSMWLGHVDIVEQAASDSILRMPVRIHVPMPENLALKAKASASSRWDESAMYAAGAVIDDIPETRWNSAPGNESGSWILLTWPEPVTFNHVVMDECVDWGLRVQAWRLETDRVIAQGTEMGVRREVALAEPVTTESLKLSIDEASVTPTIREIELYLLPESGNLMNNPSFEETSGADPAGWKAIRWQGQGEMGLAQPGCTGSNCVMISSETGGDLSFGQIVAVRPYSKYRLSGWIKTEGLEATTGRGALFNLHAMGGCETPVVTGTRDWTRVELVFETDALDTVNVNCLYGGWGFAKGKAWYDDVRLELLETREMKPTITIAAGKGGAPISKYIYGQFIEHMGRCIYGGIWAEMLEDRKFFLPVGDAESPWKALGPDGAVTMSKQDPYVGEHTPEIAAAGQAQAAGIAQAGLGLIEGKAYTGRIVLAGAQSAGPVQVTLAWGPGNEDREVVTIFLPGGGFAKMPFRFEAGGTTDDGRLEITALGTGTVRVGAISIMPADNVKGMRPDTLALLRELDSPVYRWPGGNFVSGYDWKDGIGDPDLRPPRKNPAWTGIEHNDFGIHEFMDFCDLIDTEAYITVNTGQGTAHMAANEVEYVNGAADTPMGKWRAENGRIEPWNVVWWAVGNEMYGGWQIGHMPLEDYVKKHNAVVDAMRAIDPSIKCVAVGAVGRWTEVTFAECSEHMELISEHFYVQELPGVMGHSALAPRAVKRICDAHREYRKSIPALEGKDIPIALDEWNHWYGPHLYGELGTRYFWKDGLGVARALHEYFRNSDIVFMANYAQTVNVIGCIKTSKTAAAFATTGQVLKLYRKVFGEIPVEITGAPEPLDVAAAWTVDRRALTLAVINPVTETLDLPITWQGIELSGKGRIYRIRHEDPMAYNEPGVPDRVVIEEAELGNFGGTIKVPSLSVTIYRLLKRESDRD